MSANNLEYYINLADKPEQGLRSLTSILESSVSQMLLNRTACYREIVHERKSELMQQTSSILLF